MKKNSKKDKFFLIDEDVQTTNSISVGETLPEPTHAITAKEVLGSHKEKQPQRYDGKSALDALKKRMLESTETQQEENFTLLQKCKPFILDEDGNDASQNTQPLYKLESVAQILENNSKTTIDKLAEKYEITYDYLGKFVEDKLDKAKPDESKETPEVEVYEEKIQISNPIKNLQTSVPFVISDVDSKNSTLSTQADDFSNTATITFTPITDSESEKPKILVTSNTQQLDLTDEFAVVEEELAETQNKVKLESADFDDFVPKDEVTNETEAKKFIRKFSIKKRRSFLTVSFSLILTLAISFMRLPFMSGVVLANTKTVMIICTALAGVITILNFPMFFSLSKIFTKKATADVSASLASLFVLGYSVFGILKGEIVLDTIILLSIILFLRALGTFRKHSYMLSNLKQISTTADKNAVKLINDTAVSFAMAKNFIDGDVLIAAPQKCKNIKDYIKYSTFGTFMGGKLSTITILSLILSAITGFATAKYFDGLVYGIYAAASIMCFAALPSLFLIDSLPLYRAAKKLNKLGCMIAGKAGAEHIENANAFVLDSKDIFPTGTVTLHQMKVLSENNLDETLLRAASLTECLKSPLAPIFKRIAGESNITTLPDSDTVKYEETLGISGWVDNKLLFIGNRTLMEAHGISVPSVEIDHKILRGGYFPVYVASGDKVCALLMVQYSVNPIVARELRRLTKIGVTLLINNTDPNITTEMVCDYLGLYDDAVMVMSNAGYHMYKNNVIPTDSLSAPAAYRGQNLSLAKIINCANRIKRSNSILTISYIISAILGIIIFAYTSFDGSGTLISNSTVLLYSIICTALSYLLYLIKKP